MTTNRPQIAVALVALALLALLSFNQASTTRLKSFFSWAFVPFIGVETALLNSERQVELSVESRANLIALIQELEKENTELKLSDYELEHLRAEKARFNENFGLPKEPHWSYHPARVIGRDPALWWSSLMINFGSRDGAKPDQPVVTPQGLVGRIIETRLDHSIVALIGHEQCEVPVKISGGGAQGIIRKRSESDPDPYLNLIDFLPRRGSIPAGAIVTTNGQGEVFPAGLRIGEMVETYMVSFGSYRQGIVKLSVDTNRLTHVWVLDLER